MEKNKNIGLLLLCIAITIGIGGIGGFATVSEVGSWFTTIEKPFFNPPNYLFGPVWSTLYFILGFALYAILKMESSPQKKQLLVIFSIQMVLNVLWSFLFFKFHLIGLALVEMFLMWIFIILMIKRLFQVNKPIAYAQIPYLLWVSFAFALNCSIYYLN